MVGRMDHLEYDEWKAKQDADEFCRMKAALAQIANGNWSNVQPDSRAASDLAQIVAEMQRIAAEAL
jgi:hypothetical protein